MGPKLKSRMPVQQSAKRKTLTSWEQASSGERGERLVWLPTGSNISAVSLAAQTAAVALTKVSLATSGIPPTATGLHIIASVNANTNTNGVARLTFTRDENGTTALADSAFTVASGMLGSNNEARGAGRIPIVQGGFYYGVTVAGTVDYGVTVYIVGYYVE